MYKMRNIINSAEEIESPKNLKMYKMRSYDRDANANISQNSDSVTTMTVDSKFIGKCSAAEEDLFKRQENILLQLQSCLRDVEDLKNNLSKFQATKDTLNDGIGSVCMKGSSNKVLKVSNKGIRGTVETAMSTIMETLPSSMVISLNPNELSLSIISLVLHLNSKLSAGVSIHVHSSVKNVPGPGLKLLEILKSADKENPKSRITLILKNVESPELMLSASQQRSKVRGEAPIARYLASFTALRPAAPAEEAWLDKARTASAEEVTSGLSKSGAGFLCGAEPSLADIVVLSSLCRRRVSRRSVAAWEKLLKSSDYFKRLTALF